MANEYSDDALGPRVMMVRELEADPDSSQDDESEEDEDDRWRELARGQEVPSDYWHIQRLVKYMKVRGRRPPSALLSARPAALPRMTTVPLSVGRSATRPRRRWRWPASRTRT